MARDQIEYCGNCPFYADCKACWGEGKCKADLKKKKKDSNKEN